MIGGMRAINSREITNCQYILIDKKVYMECYRLDGSTFGHWTDLTEKDLKKCGYKYKKEK